MTSATTRAAAPPHTRRSHTWCPHLPPHSISSSNILPHSISRWNVLAAALIVDAASGLFYAFSLYSADLAKRYHLTPTAIDGIGTAGNFGGNLIVHIGLLYSYKGPRAIMLLSLLVGTPAWLALYAAFTFVRLPYYALLAIGFLQGHAQAFSDCAIVPLMISLFPEHRGRVCGICKSLVGLSGALNVQIYLGAFQATPDAFNTTFLLFIAGEWLFISTLGIAAFRKLPPAKQDSAQVARSRSWLDRALVVVVLLAVLLLVVDVTPHGVVATKCFTALIMTVFALLVGFFATRADVVQWQQGPAAGAPLLVEGAYSSSASPLPPPLPQPSNSTTTLSTAMLAGDDPGSSSAAEPSSGKKADLKALSRALFSYHYFSVFVLTWFVAGSGLMLINNLKPLAQAHGCAELAPRLCSIVSASNCIGRLFYGTTSDVLLRRYATPRPYALAMVCVQMGAAMLLLKIGGTAALVCACLVGGTAYGGINSLLPPVASEIFGLELIGLMYPFTPLGMVVGSYTIATLLASHMLPTNPTMSPTYQHILILLCAGCLISAALTCVVGVRTRQLYRSLARELRTPWGEPGRTAGGCEVPDGDASSAAALKE